MINNFDDIPITITHHDTDGELVGHLMTTPLCTHFARLDLYRSDKIEWIILFEGFIIYSQIFGNGFYRQRETIMKDLRISRRIFDNNTKALIGDGYLSKVRGGKEMSHKNIYHVNFDKIIENIDQIYRFDIINSESQKYVKERYILKFNHYKDNAKNFNPNAPYVLMKYRKKQL